MLAEAHEQIVVFDPVWLGKFRAKRDFGLLRHFRPDIPPAVGNPMEVSVDADPGFTIAKGHNEIGGLAAHSVELDKLIDFVGNFAVVLFDQRTTNVANRLSFGPLETYRIDQFFDFFRAQLQRRFRRIGQREEPMGRLGRGRILGAKTENTGDQNTERTSVGFGHECNNRCLPLRHFAAQDSDCRMNIAIFHDASVL